MRSRYTLLFITLIFVFLSHPLWSIEKMNSLELLTEKFKNAGPETLIVFDSDMVLVHADFPAFQYPNLIKHRNIYKKVKESLSPERFQILANGTITQYPSILVERHTPDIIKTLQNQGIKTLVLSNALAGSFGKINNLLDNRLMTYKNLGLDFSGSFPDLSPKIFDNFEPTFGRYPEFKEGVIHASDPIGINVNKGAILVEFLKYANNTFSHIVFIDDKKKHVEDVEKALQVYDPDITFTGYEYEGSKLVSTKLLTAEEFEKAMDDLNNALQNITLENDSGLKKAS
ncbi:DUF2608 domain-containing protein [Candidatus Nucleicultrix amoebiphila]|uniref:Uncharacterized protein n=1 Tax=Candidatus Nucleicultrix amoebiphila FS5 TaxID=1414854 RepID=A0A1W6N5L7_9PROT|nr:DUF2608 domain-containing protein [Candidatus Nucleicultrix amoebiphila]ARN85170.1 hypothetical protein GQ61_07600 [Candidatus Nucleicultrix amoebiphila FS5]